MLIKNYGLFWRRDEVDWNPGKGKRGAFRLLGRRGANLPNLRLADFRKQRGIYILYGNHGPHYVGLTKAQGLGKRLRQHVHDDHADDWDRFSWFGFNKVLERMDANGLRTLAAPASVAQTEQGKMISDIEALLIRAMGLSNVAQMKFAAAKQWIQVKEHEVDDFVRKVQKR